MQRVRVILLFLGLGAIVNVAVAWGSFFKSIHHYQRSSQFAVLVVQTPDVDHSAPVPKIMYGWPLNTLLIRVDWDRCLDEPTSLDSGLYINHLPAAISLQGKARLPLQPIWPGFIANSVLYAVLLWLIFIPGLYTLRRLIRLKRGLCITCAYDLKGTDHAVCPECGAEVKLAKTA